MIRHASESDTHRCEWPRLCKQGLRPEPQAPQLTGVRLRENLRMAARHHTVPQFYLRSFADASGQVRLVDRDDHARYHLSSVHNAAAEAGFYRIEAEDLAARRGSNYVRSGKHRSGAERLGIRDGARHPHAGRGPDADFGDEVWYRLIQFTALQTVRGRRWRNDLAALATQSARIQFLGNLTDEKARSLACGTGTAERTRRRSPAFRSGVRRIEVSASVTSPCRPGPGEF